MPTHDEFEQFMREYRALTKDKRRLFRQSVRAMNEDMKAGRPFRNSLRIKGVQGHKGVFEMTWAGDGRATFMYGPEELPGEPHIVWRRIGGHKILGNP